MLDEHDPSRNSVLHNLVYAQKSRGRSDRARALAEPELARLTATLGACHPDTAELRVMLAACESSVGEHAAAIAHIEESYACLVDTDPFSAIRALELLVVVHDLRGDIAAMQATLARTEPLLARVDHPDYQLQIDVIRLRVDLDAGRLAEARARLKTIQPRLTEDPSHHDLSCGVEAALARLALSERDSAAAVLHAARAVALLAPGHPTFRGLILFVQAQAVRAAGDREHATQLAEEAIQAYEASGPGYALKIAAIRKWLVAP